MTDEHTPTTDEMRELIKALAEYLEKNYGLKSSKALPEFDRGLAARDAEQQRIGAERGWDEGYSTGYPDGYTSAKYADDENPYRKDAS